MLLSICPIGLIEVSNLAGNALTPEYEWLVYFLLLYAYLTFSSSIQLDSFIFCLYYLYLAMISSCWMNLEWSLLKSHNSSDEHFFLREENDPLILLVDDELESININRMNIVIISIRLFIIEQ